LRDGSATLGAHRGGALLLLLSASFQDILEHETALLAVAIEFNFNLVGLDSTPIHGFDGSPGGVNGRNGCWSSPRFGVSVAECSEAQIGARLWMHLVATFGYVAIGAETLGDFGKGDQGVEATDYDLRRRAGPDRCGRVIRIRLHVVRRLAQSSLGKVEIDVDIVEPTAFGESGVCRGSVIFLFSTIRISQESYFFLISFHTSQMTLPLQTLIDMYIYVVWFTYRTDIFVNGLFGFPVGRRQQFIGQRIVGAFGSLDLASRFACRDAINKAISVRRR